MIVTITGANGFIGQHLVQDQLRHGRMVRAVDTTLARLEPLQDHPALELFRADIRDTEWMRQAVTGAEIVFHLASAHLSVALSEQEYWNINHAGSRNLVQLCHLAGVKRFVHCSSVGVHGEIRHPPADEESDCCPDLIYERTKLEGERAVRQYAQETGFPVVIVRPVWVYGPGCPRTEKLFRMLKKKRFFFVGDGQALRHCIHISDMVAAFDLCAHHPNAPGKVFIFGDNAAVTIHELIHQMTTVSGATMPQWSLPLWLLKPVCFCMEHAFAWLGKEPPVSERSLKFFTNNTSFDIGRARRELGFSPQITLYEGLRSTYDAMTQTRG